MRLKIVAGNLAVVVLLGLVAYFTVSNQVRNLLSNQLDSDIDNSRVLFDRSFRLSTLEFESRVAERAATRQLRDIFSGLDLDSRRTRAYDAAEATHGWFGDPARGGRGAPDIVVVVDETGTAIARNGARNVMFGTPLLPAIPALGRALKSGEAQHDVWLEKEQNKVLQTAVAPIRSESGTVLGALIVGYDLSNGLAANEARVLGRDVAFLVDGKVYSSSLDGSAARDLRAQLFEKNAQSTKGILGSPSGSSQPWRAKLAGDDYIGITSRLPLAESLPVGFAVLGNRTEATQIANVANVILIMMVLGALLVIGYGLAIGTSIMRPIEQIEEGVLQVINGRTDLRLETDSAELGGLAFRINQLLNVFTGTEEASEDEEGKISVPPSEGHWKDDAFADERARGASSAKNPAVAAPAAGGAAAAGSAEDVVDDAAVAGELAKEAEETYQERLYREYVSAKQALGENVSNIPKDRFWQRLAGRAEALVQKHGCRMVRFQVHTLDNQVVLRPVLIR
ncbi:MAG TPA: MXAN_5187 C-terminal domain-containing protein [Polyangiales bacterium]|nr:MXAN_5187 C-terminal domain-containing protein [Polyangiales bacterium]